MEKMEKLIDKVAKLMKKAERTDNDAEAQSFMLKAQELMVKNGLSMDSIELKDKPKKEVVETEAKVCKSVVAWVRTLHNIIGENFRCKAYGVPVYGDHIFVKGKIQGQRLDHMKLKYIGLKEDVEIAMLVFTTAENTVRTLSRQYVKDKERIEGRKISIAEFKKIQTAWIGGFIYGLSDKFEEQIQKNNWGLILVQDDAVVKRVEEKELVKAPKSKVNYHTDSVAMAHGYKAGKEFEADNNKLAE